jgi:hypothetical protein
MHVFIPYFASTLAINNKKRFLLFAMKLSNDSTNILNKLFLQIFALIPQAVVIRQRFWKIL